MDDIKKWQEEFRAYIGGLLLLREDYRGIMEYIDEVPTIEPEITRCAECIHWKHSAVRENYCEVFDWLSKAEDFCSFAERGTDATD